MTEADGPVDGARVKNRFGDEGTLVYARHGGWVVDYGDQGKSVVVDEQSIRRCLRNGTLVLIAQKPKMTEAEKQVAGKTFRYASMDRAPCHFDDSGVCVERNDSGFPMLSATAMMIYLSKGIAEEVMPETPEPAAPLCECGKPVHDDDIACLVCLTQPLRKWELFDSPGWSPSLVIEKWEKRVAEAMAHRIRPCVCLVISCPSCGPKLTKEAEIAAEMLADDAMNRSREQVIPVRPLYSPTAMMGGMWPVHGRK